MRHLSRNDSRRDERGAALILAIGLLAVLAVMGTYYVRFTMLEQEDADLALAETRARLAAEAGVQAAVGRLIEARKQGAVKMVLSKANTFDFPVYRLVRGAASLDMAPHQRYRTQAEVNISAEDGRINVNLAPAPVLQAALGVDEVTAATIASSVAQPHGRLADCAELAARGWLSKAQWEQSAQESLTAIGAPEAGHGGGYFNLNTASRRAAAAALGVSEEAAAAILEKGPFQNLESLQAAVTAVLQGAAPAPALPAQAFLFESRCFRIVSEGRYARVDEQGREYHGTAAHVEAVVRFDASGNANFIYWNAGNGKKNG